MDWLKLSEDLSKKAGSSAPPTQWIFMTLLVLVALFAGFSLDRELAESAVQRDALKRKKRLVEELKIKAKAAQSAQEAAALLNQISELKIRMLKQESDFRKSRVDLNDRLLRLRAAKNWKELDDA